MKSAYHFLIFLFLPGPLLFLGLFFAFIGLVFLLQRNDGKRDEDYWAIEERRHRQSTPLFRTFVLCVATAGLSWLLVQGRHTRPIFGLMGCLLMLLGFGLGFMYIWRRYRARVELDRTERWPYEPFREKWDLYPLYRCTILCQLFSLVCLLVYNL